MTVADIIDGAFAILKIRPRTIVVITAVFVIPLELFAAYLNRQNYTDDVGEILEASGNTPFGAFLIISVLGWLIMPFVAAAIAHVVSSWYAAGDLDSSTALRRTFAQTPALLGAFVAIHLIEIVGVVVLVLPVVTIYVVTAPAIAVEGLGAFAGMQRSFELVRRRFWPVLGIIVLGWLVESALGFAIGAVPQLFATLLTERFDWIIVALFNIAAGIITTSVVAGASVLLYLDLRVRTEAMDLVMASEEHFDQSGLT